MSDCSVVIGIRIGYSPAGRVTRLHADRAGAEDRQARHLDPGDGDTHQRLGARFKVGQYGRVMSGSVS